MRLSTGAVRLLGAAALGAGLLVGDVREAHAQGPGPASYFVVTNDGSRYQGELVESVVGGHTTIRLATGEILVFEPRDVQSQGPLGRPAAVVVAPPPPEPPPPPKPRVSVTLPDLSIGDANRVPAASAGAEATDDGPRWVAAVIAERPVESTEGLPGMRTLALVLVEFMLNLYRRELPTLAPGDAGLILNDIISGVMAAYLIVYCVRDLRLGQAGVITAFLSSRPLVKLGHFAYSVYLIHAPVLAVLHSALQTTPLTSTERLAVMIFVGLPLVGAVAYPFSRLFERPFMVKRAKAAPPATAPSAPATA